MSKEQREKTVYLVRHGEVLGSQPGLLVGRTDLGLSENGRRQSVALRPVLREVLGADSLAVMCSPLLRARETASLALGWAENDPRNSKPPPELDIEVALDADLAEIDFGEWELRSFGELEVGHPKEIAAWSEFRPDFAFPGGETLAAFLERVGRVAGRLAAADHSHLLVFSHGGVIRTLVCHFLGIPLKHYLVFDIAPASVTTLRLWGERGVLSGLRTVGEGKGMGKGWVWRRSFS